jgi:hypothetical protein
MALGMLLVGSTRSIWYDAPGAGPEPEAPELDGMPPADVDVADVDDNDDDPDPKPEAAGELPHAASAAEANRDGTRVSARVIRCLLSCLSSHREMMGFSSQLRGQSTRPYAGPSPSRLTGPPPPAG